LQVGCASYRIDLAVLDPQRPGNYLLGIEFDGPTYSQAAAARDRDRLRHEVMQRLGWKLHRIWSPAWLHRRQEELERLLAALHV
jgi:very-short-patch-repair endonuclease